MPSTFCPEKIYLFKTGETKNERVSKSFSRKVCRLMERLLSELDLSLYGTDTEILCDKLRSSFRVIEHNADRLPDIYQKYLQHRQSYSLYVRSHMGSGKTFQLKKIIKNMRICARKARKDLRVLIITPKRTFASYVTSQLKDFVDYRCIRKPYSCARYPRLVVQLQSLKKFDDIEIDSYSVRGYSVVILDEIHSIVEELFSDLFDAREKRKHILLFIKILRTIPRWICLDAHLSLDLIRVLSLIDEDSHRIKSQLCLINKYTRSDFKLIFYRKCLFHSLVIRIFKQKLCKSDEFQKYKPLFCTQKIADVLLQDNTCLLERLYQKIYIKDFLTSTDRSDILVDLYDALSRGCKICVTTATKKQAFMLQKLYKACGFKVKVITGDSSEQVKAKFARDPDSFVRGCQLFIYTTAFQVGIDVSSKETYFHTQYVFIECSTRVASPGSFIQAIGRIRTLRSKEYKIIVMETKRENNDKKVTNMNDLLPKHHGQILPIMKTNNRNNDVCTKLVDLHHKESALSNNVYLYVNMFIRLFGCKAKPYVMIRNQIYPSESIVNFHTFQFCYQQYGAFIDGFISLYKEEIQKTLDKHINKIWKKLETSSIYVSTIVNNFDAFVKVPNDMSRAECLLKVCEFSNMSFGFLHTFVFETCSTCGDMEETSHLKRRYFEQGVRCYFEHCTLNDLERFKTLVWNFLQTCINNGSCLWKINSHRFLQFLESSQGEIVFCYSRFVSNVISKSVTIRKLFERLMSKLMHMYIQNFTIDVSEIFAYKRVIEMNNYLIYNAKLLESSVRC